MAKETERVRETEGQPEKKEKKKARERERETGMLSRRSLTHVTYNGISGHKRHVVKPQETSVFSHGGEPKDAVLCLRLRVLPRQAKITKGGKGDTV